LAYLPTWRVGEAAGHDDVQVARLYFRTCVSNERTYQVLSRFRSRSRSRIVHWWLKDVMFQVCSSGAVWDLQRRMEWRSTHSAGSAWRSCTGSNEELKQRISV